ncbi:hypothetical protein CKAN_02253400 [Cinnamomum micranthum f. kanehirae]|uniref:Uncharacterized protein n=1 Tax=Cinnamomum micranthum f. kanehirae TaxID=337451 RepID=A0A3S4PPT7_9MAGN|nr:hypothetical protein CKAN_02253400 [Cinnamomum micranthum f. kanehirae]
MQFHLTSPSTKTPISTSRKETSKESLPCSILIHLLLPCVTSQSRNYLAKGCLAKGAGPMRAPTHSDRSSLERTNSSRGRFAQPILQYARALKVLDWKTEHRKQFARANLLSARANPSHNRLPLSHIKKLRPEDNISSQDKTIPTCNGRGSRVKSSLLLMERTRPHPLRVEGRGSSRDEMSEEAHGMFCLSDLPVEPGKAHAMPL